MAKWRKQFLLKKQNPSHSPFDKLVKNHTDAIEKMIEALHKRTMTGRA